MAQGELLVGQSVSGYQIARTVNGKVENYAVPDECNTEAAVRDLITELGWSESVPAPLRRVVRVKPRGRKPKGNVQAPETPAANGTPTAPKTATPTSAQPGTKTAAKI